MSPSRLEHFLTADGRDGAGRTFEAVLAMDDAQLEARHDFVQWLFPLTEPSAAVPGSPYLDAATLQRLRGSSTARARLQAAADRMLGFYSATSAWRARFDHNHLRITRIIRSLRLIAGDEAAEAFRAAILALAADAPIDATARRYWAQA